MDYIVHGVLQARILECVAVPFSRGSSQPKDQTQISGICLQCRRSRFNSWAGMIHWRRDRLPTPVFLGFPCGSAAKESACNAGDLDSIHRLGRFPWRSERLPTPVFWPGEFHGLYSPWGHKELDTTEQLSLSLHMWNVKNDTDELIYKPETDSEISKSNLWLPKGKLWEKW